MGSAVRGSPGGVAGAGVALVTGGARRIGREIALGLADEGYAVAIHYHRAVEAAEDVATQINDNGGRSTIVDGDLADAGVLSRVMDAAATLGPVTCLVNNAARFEYDEATGVSVADWDAHMDINLRAPVILAQAFARQVPAGVDANIINMIDERVWKLVPTHFSYTVSKAGLWAATRMLAQSFAPYIRVNAIGPGPTLANKDQSHDDFLQENRNMLLGHGTTPQEIVAAIRFILNAPSMTGQMIALDGGQHLLWQTPDMKGMELAAPGPTPEAHKKGSP